MKAKKRKMISFFMLILLPGILCACGEKRPVSVVVENDTSQTDGESLKSKMEVPVKIIIQGYFIYTSQLMQLMETSCQGLLKEI